MRVELEMTTAEDGALVGTAVWAEGSATASFHGTLELVALVQRAVAADPVIDVSGSGSG